MDQSLNEFYDELIELIYQIPHNLDAWQQFAKKIIHILDASYVHIQAIDFNYQVLSFSNGIGPLAAENYVLVELDYLHYPTEADPRWGKFLDPQRTGWYQCHSHVSDEFVQQSDLYQNILLPYGLRYVATHELIWDEKLCVFWSISTSQQRQPLNQQELAFLDVLLPHLKRVVMAQRHLYEFSATNIVGYNLIDQLAQPIMLLNLSGNVVHFNPAMQDFLQNTDLIKVENQQLYLPQQSQIQFLKILYQIEVAFRQQHEQLQQYKELKFFIPDTGLFFTIHLLVSEKEQSFFGIRPLVMLKFYDTDTKLKIHLSEQKLKSNYHLSKREIEVCQLFANGYKFPEIAKAINITLTTVRTYFKRIFLKTNCTSQAELMKLLVSTSLS
ncbi:helix-turn-helix transcriptional regulator [Acinetobacter qingfengensis]|uniref:Helix-turn-helix transcriptional regulator n=1 Tax=Acinetobacter qingfengensis TaxID=1262585 RepID=A0A1E7RFC1_9GAMM|nr:helix-turn-helix transcriptional regulator [Acinetobacter qingfengensis]KAA8731178.1 helix-turn-helix transcriptional regulator [Acinetobacter qingfengensis]OEY97855.1 helix-turn-helix transcriptional regulator [Acinetobacter qingfengensis]